MNKPSNLFFFILFTTSIFGIKAHAYGNNFSCPFGTQGSCLNHGDKVCSSFSKCVDNNAICFDNYTCGYGGFVCKSQLDDIVSEYDTLLRKCKKIAEDHDSIVIEYNNLLYPYEKIKSEYEDLESCVYYAYTLEEAKECI